MVDVCFRRSNNSSTVFLNWLKLKLDDLRGFFRRRHKLPFFHRVLASLHEHWVSAHDPRALDMSVRTR